MQNINKLNALIEVLNDNQFSAVTITNAIDGKVLFSNFSHENIKNDFADAESFFNSIHENGNTKIIIQEKRKNGSTYKSINTSFFIETGEKTPEKQSESLADSQSEAFAIPTQKTNENNNVFGLGQLDVMNLMLDSRDAKRLQNENELIKSENKKLLEENKELKEKELKDKYDSNKETTKNELIAGLMGQAPAIVAGLKGLFGQPVTGLAGAETPNLHPINTIDNSTKDILFMVNDEVLKNPEFSIEFFELLKKYQLWQ